ncbi:hypothetical protein GOP47_0013016 [Adiantum capillus-veneris]|uniref:YqaJ viral recombinase domain-containing protein n=1 Tax=Adiantum capillus-veneris TaxID=13818 RepID=A0A9D4ZH32_ADICA|nr:hypothetical protein GOP47_0013016 [Adiantum capillus-veneris]
MIWALQRICKRAAPTPLLYTTSTASASRKRTRSADTQTVEPAVAAVDAAAVAPGGDSEQEIPLVLKQRTEQWQELRQDRLTASTFASVLGFFGNFRRTEVWAQKLGLLKPFPGNTATDWGIKREAEAIQMYEEFTGMTVKYLAFKIYQEGDKRKEWIGGSPDGLVEPGLPEASSGILEVKCPYNSGKPEFCVPWSEVPFHHMPQIQGLMEILDRDWLDVFVWTMNGCALFRVERDPDYWELIFDVLKDFWWGSVVPGKRALESQKKIDVNVFKPILRHKMTPTAVRESKRLSKKALLITKFLV